MTTAVIKWNIERLECKQAVGEFSNVVTTAYFNCVGTDNFLHSNFCSSCNLPDPEENFVPFEQLTEEQVLSWIWENVDKAGIEQTVRDQLVILANPPIKVMQAPWATTLS